MKKEVIIFILLLFLFPLFLNLAKAEVQNLGTFKTGECVVLKQTCANCTSINLTLSIPPNQTTYLVNISMNRVSQNLWTYPFCNTSINGQYVYDTVGDLNGQASNDPVSFTINPLGKVLTSAQSTLYFLVFVVAFIFFVVCLIFGFTMDGKNKSDQMTGYVLAVNNLKYLKVFMIAIAYLMLMLMVYFGWIISYAYLDLDALGNLFNVAFYALVVLIFPMFVIGAYVIISNAVRDAKIGKLLGRGLKTRG